MNDALSAPLFRRIGRIADEKGLRAFVIGGYVRDHFLHRPCTDIDIVVVGSGIEVAEALGRELKTKVSVFKNFGTAMLRCDGWEVEFVGARKESYRADSRKPIVEDGTIEDDQLRRDFTINAMAFSLNAGTFGELVDPFDGMRDLENYIIRTPCDSDTTFSDDPLRMIRAIRFATQLGFDIEDETFEAIRRNRERIEIISQERIITEMNKIMLSPVPSIGFQLFDNSGLLELIFPELSTLKGVETRNDKAHKDNFLHTLKVLDNVALKSDNLYLRWAALLHDIGKIREISAEIGFPYTSEGRLLGHITMSCMMVQEAAAKLRLPSSRLEQLQHILLSHHGDNEKGSPVACSTREAFVVHYADEINAVMNQFDVHDGKSAWEFNRMLGRNILVDKL